MVWSGVRIIFADVFFAKYGVNIWIFAAVEFISCPIFARATAKMIDALVQHRFQNSAVWGLVTLVTFGAPDVYLLTTGKNLPWSAYFVVIGIMLIGGLISIVKLRSKTLILRRSIT
jgi:hypothetical protein